MDFVCNGNSPGMLLLDGPLSCGDGGPQNLREIREMIERTVYTAMSPQYFFPPPPAMIEAPRPDAERERQAIKEAEKWRTCVQVFEQENAQLRARLIAYEDAARAAPKEVDIWRTRAPNAELSLRAADFDDWRRRALAAESAVEDMAWELHNRDIADRAAAPKQPHPHEALHRALGVSDNGGHAPQTHNQVFWERLL